MNKGLYGKYTVIKANGEPIDPDAQYFVLRIDTDKHARVALEAYADSIMEDYRVGQIDNPKLAFGIRDWLFKITSQILDKKEE